MRFQYLAITCITWIAMIYGPICLAEVGEKTDDVAHNFIEVPQEFVVCTGWHALCSNSTDCTINGDKAYCDCMRVNETHIVYTREIQDAVVKTQTQTSNPVNETFFGK